MPKGHKSLFYELRLIPAGNCCPPQAILLSLGPGQELA